MNIRLRFLVILFGALLVALAYTFNLWIPFFQNQGEVILFPELPTELREAFDTLPIERQNNYLDIRSEDPQLALRMAIAALQPDTVLSDEEQIQPQREGQVAVRQGEFVRLTPNRSAEGTMTIYEMPDGSRYLWLEDFSVINGPALRLFLSPLEQEMLDELAEDDDETNDEYQLSLEDLRLDPLRANFGNQAYEVPGDEDLARYNSVLIYSTDLNLLYSFAEFEE